MSQPMPTASAAEKATCPSGSRVKAQMRFRTTGPDEQLRKEMVDLPSGATSRRMANVRRAATAPELLARKILSGFGIRYRTSNRDLPGSPDLANRRHGWVVFVHGCFWHRHPRCRRTSTPTRNVTYWTEKFRANVRRDRQASSALEQAGWRVYTIWECSVETDAHDVGSVIIKLSVRKPASK
ncbi:MAG TPA: very short patch repair endonuclease [Thermoanaerobaculia bacterium]|nr:very short patch repair endonuclease [Thermoanaerobaculia bacterium]